MTVLAFLSLSFSEMLVIGVVALLVFGGRLPEVMRNLGRSYAKFRQGMHDATNPLRQELRRLDLRTPDTATPTTSPGLPEPREVPPYEPSASRTPTAEAEPLSNGEGAAPTEKDGNEAERTSTPFPKTPPPRHASGGVADEPPPV